MSVQESDYERASVNVKNVGGIDETVVAFTDGVTVLTGRNATNRTSFLQALMAALGSDNVSVKGDADEAEVELTIDDVTYTRTLHRQGQTVTAGGDPFLEDTTLADLYAFLLESNEARRGVARDDDLRDYIMRPVDVDEIQAEIRQLVEERKALEEELDAINSKKARLPGLEEKRTKLESQIEAKREELAEKEAELESADADVEQSREEKQELDEKLDELRDRRSELEDVRYDIETERQTVQDLRSERSELEAKADELPDTPAGELSELESEIDRLRTEKKRIEPQINDLQSIISFNQDLLNGDDHEVQSVLAADNDDAVTDRLLDDQEITCWTCGTAVETDEIETTVNHLRELSQNKLDEVRDIDDELATLSDRRKSLKDQRRERERVERKLTSVGKEIEDSETTIERLQERREELTEEIKTVEKEVQALEDDSYSKILDLHKEANQFEYEIGKFESNLERVGDEIADIEDAITKRSDIEDERDAIQGEIEDLRTKIDRIEREAVEAFNEHMETVLELLDYENLERIWLERVEEEVRDGRRKVSKNAFYLHVVRSTASGTTYEDTIDHLSESEREVTGLVFALAGYLVHDVNDTVPFMLLDSLEAIDSERISSLVTYLSDHTDFLVVALLQEDAEALDDDHQRITAI